MSKALIVVVALASLALCGVSMAADGKIVVRTAAASNPSPMEAGKAAAAALKESLGGVEPKAIILSECFEDKENKELVIKGVASVFPAEKIFGGASYGMYTQAGVQARDAVSLLAIGGEGVTVASALEEKMGAASLTLEKDKEKLTAALQSAGERLAKKLPAQGAAMMFLIADAHSPKNQLLIDGVQNVLGKKLPITGGSVNKNAEQNWVCYQGKLYTDAALAVTLAGDFAVAQTGRQAKDNDMVISTAKEGSAEAVKKLAKTPFLVVAYDCAGRKGKLKNLADELAVIQQSVGKDVPLFGCYCAGEFGPADAEDVTDKTVPYGRGWHVMFTVFGK